MSITNAALSGLRAASTDLQVTGNNVANAGTFGFKQSRVLLITFSLVLKVVVLVRRHHVDLTKPS